ncbi:uncharacterized protein LOC110608874 [Manihot esculenta]|uniref:uncharacterized protein LOC110608874 n=1 Tax=Manihot esculenta TaxID=3983 RepID=UPI000B5D19AC|nr:uncharacterized protein LOC110608874 [Manihot esculenta]
MARGRGKEDARNADRGVLTGTGRGRGRGDPEIVRGRGTIATAPSSADFRAPALTPTTPVSYSAPTAPPLAPVAPTAPNSSGSVPGSSGSRSASGMGDHLYTSSSYATRTYCYVNASGNLMPSEKTSGACTKIFQKYNVEEGSSWKNIQQSTKDFYFREFEKEFHWDEGSAAIVRKAWNKKAATRYKDFLTNEKKKKKRSAYISTEVWDKWNLDWSTPEYVAKSMKYSKNRLTEKGGEGAGPSTHTGGSITHEEHARRIQNANTDKVPPTAAELFLHTHTKKSDRNKFVDKRAEIVYENYLKLKEQHSSQNVGSDHVEGDGGTINEDQLFITAAGGWQGSRVYGLGSAASSAFSQTGTVGKTTDVPSSQSPEWKKEIEAKFEEKYNSLQKIVEDQSQIIAQMRDELQATRMGQQSSSLMPSTSDMPPAQRSPGDSHID